MRVLVLGSDGQIGRPLTSYLKEPGREILKYWKPEMSLKGGIINIIVQSCPI